MKFILGFVVALIVLAIGAVVFAYSGVYNVAAGAPEPGILQWFLTTTMHHSVKSHAPEVAAPFELTDERARDGFSIYRDACVYCHGAPQQDPGDIGKGLNPKAPYLGDTVGGVDQRPAVLDRQERDQNDRHGALRRVAQG